MIHEDILKDIKAGGLYTKYLIGELRADFLDSDDGDDIITSNRQGLNEDDPRYILFRDWVAESVMKPIGNRWRDWRRDQATAKAKENPVVKKWFSTLGKTDRQFAKKLFGKIGSFPLEDEEARKELYRHTILAFERLKFRDLLGGIDSLGDELNLEGFGALFDSIDELEAAQYHRIASGRMEVIKAFQTKLDVNEKEQVIQKYLFEHLWLLHPAWERATTDQVMEKNVQKALNVAVDSLSDEEKKARLDIAFRSAPGHHVVIELKRYEARVHHSVLYTQLSKYHSAITKALAKFDDKRTFEIIAVLGHLPHGGDMDKVKKAFQAYDARWVTYDNLISEALASYDDYLKADKAVSDLAAMLEDL